MKVIIPAAGTGTRLFPHTHTKPKPMVYIAGKPIIGHILDRMIDLEPEEIIVVVGYHKDQLISYINEHYRDIFNITYVEQEKRLGLAHSVYITREYVNDSDIMIALGDMIFKTGYMDFYQKHNRNKGCAGSIGVKEVEEPKKYGIVELEQNSACIKKLEEKPETPASNLGIAGVYFIKDTQMLYNILENMINNDVRSCGEFQLTDALQEMVQLGSKLKTFEVSSWYDCGHAASLLETNQVLLIEKENISCNFESVDSVIIHPVAIGDKVKINNSVIGPHASIADGTIVEDSIISNSVIGSHAYISKVNLQSSIIGDEANVVGKHNSLNIGDSSSIEF
ncbi:MAG: glucose-phosphate thymidylyltransferase [Methanolobus sp.]|uniref:sugar phosphate nucleotidyltransferase n=1 Tax=Methanolobus sp. TaxID=1874737 RepID=UPI00258E1E2A|nr:sugar phosphate nucleotidyltransferase [Methanolobus sp.]MDK2831280.1 glucose-phosphate thymidylyltransferase [Methanolobus sp.]